MGKDTARKKYYLFCFVIIFMIIVVIVIYTEKKQSEEKQQLEKLYYKQNTAFRLCSDINKRKYYHGAVELDLKDLYMKLFVFDYLNPEYNLTVDEVIDYLSDEYDLNGKPKIYSQPDNIKIYIEWSIDGGRDVADSFRGRFIYYLVNKKDSDYDAMSYDEAVAALEEYQESPEFIPPGDK